jgi:peptidoglycan/xylan/chitin deacetylase (PgdA/CDA1 family)
MPPSRLLGQEWSHIPTGQRVVALTFDAGANADGVAAILSTLARERIRATFFLTGNWVQVYPTPAKQIGAARRGADHSVTHPHFTELSDTQMRTQVLDAATLIRRYAQANLAPWFRFPYGDRNAHTIAVVNAVGYVPIGWTVDTLGWEGTSSGISTQRVIDRVLAALAPGEIVLMHVGSHPTDHSTLDADALPRMIDSLRARGYAFVTLDALLP